ncbi:MAG: SDR family oxidoreductase [Chitinophagaceae bacterium]|nr:SDR family oxidoreductase [Chitinophagaceae bacterium]
MNLSLEGRTAVVCGSTQGIGLAIAEELALLGANCILLSRNEPALKEAIQKLDIANRQLHSYKVADFSQPEQVKKAIDELIASQSIQILINNTGGPPPGPIIDATDDEFISAFNQHLICNHILVQAVVPGMKQAGYGRIVNIISTSVKIPNKNLGVSNTIRGGVASWAKTMANELGQFNITVNNVLPGYTGTQRLKSLIEKNAAKRNVGREVIEKEMMHEIPMKRFGDAAEIAAMAAFLATPAASYVNGVSIQVDGGRIGSI